MYIFYNTVHSAHVWYEVSLRVTPILVFALDIFVPYSYWHQG